MEPSWESTKKSSQGEDLRRKKSCCNYKGGDTCINCLRGSFMDGYREHNIISGQKNANGTGSFLIQITPSLACRNINKIFFARRLFVSQPLKSINLDKFSVKQSARFHWICPGVPNHQANAKKKGSDSWGFEKKR